MDDKTRELVAQILWEFRRDARPDTAFPWVDRIITIIEAGASLEVREKIIPYLEDLLMMSQPVMVSSLQMLIYSLKLGQPEHPICELFSAEATSSKSKPDVVPGDAVICVTCPPGTPIDKCQCEHTTAGKK